MYSTDIPNEFEFNHLLEILIKKNLFTKRQISIIYNKNNKHIYKNKISSGAYYRQIKQCKKKYERLIYTILLFRLLGFMDSHTFNVIESIVKQIGNVSQQKLYHNKDITFPNDIAQVIDQIITKINKI